MNAEQSGQATYCASELESIPKEIVEGVLSEGVAEIKYALDDIHENIVSTRFVECVIANRQAIMLELGKVCGMLGPYANKALRPKHRAARALFQEFARRVGDNEITEDSTDADMARFARDTVGFLECVHMCLNESTSRQKRHYWKKRYIDA